MQTKRIHRPWQPRRQFHNYGNKTRTDPYYQTREYKAIRKNYIMQNPDCEDCLEEGTITPCYPPPATGTVDHIVPRNKGGSDEEYNLRTRCPHHNAIKTAKDK